MVESARRAPEVVQTSWLDCGPAALTSMLRGLGAPAPYDRVRTLCSTGVDGTSIDSIEAVATAAGLDAEQLVVPLEQIAAMPERYIPAVIVTVLPDGFAHFVLLWRLRRGRAHLMDPATGRRVVSWRRWSKELYRHDLSVPAAAWREWAGGPDFQEGLRRRMVAQRVSDQDAADMLALALEDAGPRRLAALDAALRVRESGSPGVRSGGVSGELLGHVLSGGIGLPQSAWSCVLDDDDRPSAATLRGAVLVRARSWDPAAADPKVLGDLHAPEPSPYRAILDAARRSRWLLLAVALGAACLAVAQAAELLLLRSLLAAARPAAVAVAVILVVAASTLIAVLVSIGALRVGRDLDTTIRRAWLSATRRLPPSFVRSRPLSDLVFRAHSTHRLREFPLRIARLITTAAVAIAAATAIVAVAPAIWPAAVILLVAATAVPWIFSRALVQTDLRVQTLSGCLARPVADALLGVQAVRQRGVAPALLVDHDLLAATWRRAVRHAALLTALSQLCAGIVGAVILTWGLSSMSGRSTDTVLLVLVMGIVIVTSGALCSDIVATLPAVRSTLLRQSGPLNTTEPHRPAVRAAIGAAIELRGASVFAGSVPLLDDVTLTIPTGSHVAIVGASGAGKSTLMSVVLGTTDLDGGEVRHEESPRVGEAAWSAPNTWLWGGDVEDNLRRSATEASASARSRLALVGVEQTDLLARRQAGEGGALLSDGQAQRVRLARALGRPHAPLVVLDEALRGLTPGERSRILAAVRSTWRRSTLLCALHEIADAVGFDLVVVMVDGRVHEVGAPATLLKDPKSRFHAMLAAAGSPFTGWTRIDLARTGSAAQRTLIADAVPTGDG